MSKAYYDNPNRRVGPGRGHPNIIEDEALFAMLPATVVEVAAHFGTSRSGAYYRLRALLSEGSVKREPSGDRFDLWMRA